MAGFDLTYRRGDAYKLKLTITDGETPVDLSGCLVFYTLKAEVDNDLEDSAAIIRKDVSEHSDPENGMTEIMIDGADTDGLVPGEKYVHDVQIVSAAGKPWTPLYGKVKCAPDVTRRTS